MGRAIGAGGACGSTCASGSGGQGAAALACHHDVVGHATPKSQIASLDGDNHGSTTARDDADLFTWDESHILQVFARMRAAGKAPDVNYFATFALR